MNYYIIRNIDNYTLLCTIEVDLSHLPLSLLSNHSGVVTFYCLDYEIVLLFGQTEVEAMLAWKEYVSPLLVLFHTSLFTKCCQGIERWSAARIIYDPDPTDDDL